MAMLAEPRQRKRYNLTPRGKALYEDDTRFGTKMLEKMGWSKGKGLGAKENGSQDFVRVRMRNTNEGLGFEDRDDHWTQHEQDFNGLLNSLNGEEGDNEKDSEEKESASDEETPRVGFGFAPKKPKVEKLKDKISGVSLEQKSKLSKARVHYQKFTKGKDIAQYSEKDLANIFGKKVVETEQADGVYAQLTAIMTKDDVEKSETADAEEKEIKPNFGGVQTISTGLSVSDYFKQKMEAIKNKQKQNNNEQKVEETVELQIDEATENKKKSKKRKHERETVEAESQSTEANALVEGESSPISKRDKKKQQENSVIETVDLTDEVDEDEEVPKKMKKKKKSKENQLELHTNQNEVIDEIKEEENSVTEAPKKKKKSKKSKRKQSQDNDDVIIVGEEAPTYEKSLEEPKQAESPAYVVPTDDIEVKKNKKSKKEKRSEKTPQLSETKISVDVVQTTKKSKKSKKDVSENNKVLTLDELKEKYNTYNIYTISSFVAEKFRNVALDSFKKSTITHIPGYAHTDDFQLQVVNEPKDEERITRLWNCSEDKYVEVNPKAIYGRYKQNTINAYKTKNKSKKPLPLFNIKSLKRKSVFQPI